MKAVEFYPALSALVQLISIQIHEQAIGADKSTTTLSVDFIGETVRENTPEAVEKARIRVTTTIERIS